MVVFGVEVEDHKEMKEYIQKVENRFKEKNLLKNPFSADISYKNGRVIVYMKPLYPNPFWLGIITLLPFFIFGLSWWILLPGFIMASGVTHTPWFSYYLFMKGAKRAGYLGKYKRVSTDEIIRRLM
jgi:hypothetical protein